MSPIRKWLPLALAGLVALVATASLAGWIIARSEVVLDRRESPPTSSVRADSSPQAIARGAHLTLVTACAACHGDGLRGKTQTVAGSPVVAPNLTMAVARLTDAQLDAALRRGLRPDGRSELAMPSHVYSAFTDDEVASIIGYLRSLHGQGTLARQPPANLLLRFYLVTGFYQTQRAKISRARPPLDAGPSFGAGRHLAQIACGQCHGADLGGGDGAPGPDLTVRGYYSRAQFHGLMRNGDAVGEMRMEMMSRTAVQNFSHFDDAEIDALYDYLDARDRILSGDAKRRGGA